ncbi:hypothetical protein [Pararhodobacter zhoushanensis]|uniref:XRE family transcriptional regulator n=1 Tax=Pararhodobacter zhoushanensis TaxID=2479545 RepID=A0ABT3H460_9RHOB|nr:hypothetical protein [Pararhodobacter zhoushanensis]MCW1934555.1 hypothetical protein [Pararhodobacter zhoushanensis]
MEQFLSEIERYAAAAGVMPQSVLRRSCGYGWDVWDAWKRRKSSPTMVNADRVRAWMAANPPLDQAARVEAAE